MHHAEFRDGRLVPVYDAAFPWSVDDDFFASVVDRTPGARVLDLGCGTGRLALALAGRGHVVTGIDPAGASLEVARAKPGADRVTWIEGISAAAPTAAFDVAVMTSHVAQFFVDDDDWRRTLTDLARALVPGATLAFDTRDPKARGWERWNPADSLRPIVLPDGRTVTMWAEVTAVDGPDVAFTLHYRFPDGEALHSTATLRFRTEEEVRSSLVDAGFTVEAVFGGWASEPVGAGDGELLFVARR